MNPYDLTPAQVAALRRGAAVLDRFERYERYPGARQLRRAAGSRPPAAPTTAPTTAAGAPPRRRRVVLATPTAAERRFVAEGPAPAPQPPRRRSVTLADLRRERPDLADALVASGYRLGHGVRDVSTLCAWCHGRHRRDFQCEPMRNRAGTRAGTRGPTYHEACLALGSSG